MDETTASAQAASVDRAALRAELERTRAAYRALVADIGDPKWKLRSGNPAWTCGQLAWHLGASGAFVAGLVENARKGKGTNPPSFLLGPIFKASELRVKFLSRKATPASVLADYDAGHERLLRLLDALDDGEFSMSATNFGETRTIAEQFGIPVSHFAEHGPEVRSALSSA